MLECFDELA